MRDPEALVVLHLYLVFLASCMHAYLYCFCVSFSRDDADGGCEFRREISSAFALI